jgi:hypothetical protein
MLCASMVLLKPRTIPFLMLPNPKNCIICIG